MQKLTKIVATISDRKCEVDFLKKLYDEGMNVVRLNTAHQGYDDTQKVIDNVRAVSDKIALLLDTKGPEIRTTKLSEDIPVVAGDIVKVKGDPDSLSSKEMVCVSYPGFVNDVPVGASLLIDDGEIELIVKEKNNEYLTCEVTNKGNIEGRKSVNCPGVSISLPALSEKDLGYVNFAIEQDLDFIAHSFVRSKEDVLAIQNILDKHNSDIKIIAKIENQEGIDNIDEILDYAYGVMIARGDLAIEVPREKIPFYQKQLIKKCNAKRKPVIVATQMLHTMIKNPRPTRAEVTDIATAIFDGTDAIMLSGETAYGDYPIEAVQTMTRIVKEVQSVTESQADNKLAILTNDISAHMCRSAVQASESLDCTAIVADTTTGRTVRNVTGFRGKKPVLALVYNPRTARELALSYGVSAYHMEKQENHDQFIKYGINKLNDKGVLNESDRVVILAGSFGKSRGANFIEIADVKDLV